MLCLRMWRSIYLRFTLKQLVFCVWSLGQNHNAYLRGLHKMSQTSLGLHFQRDNKVKNPYKNTCSMLDHFGVGKNGFDKVLSLHFWCQLLFPLLRILWIISLFCIVIEATLKVTRAKSKNKPIHEALIYFYPTSLTFKIFSFFFFF